MIYGTEQGKALLGFFWEEGDGFCKKKTALTPAANGEAPDREKDVETPPKALRAADDEGKKP